MRGRHSVATLLLSALVAGCGGGTGEAAVEAPPLGGPAPTPSTPPTEPMDHLEQPVADRLAGQVRDEGLTLEHVSCPPWGGAVPTALDCAGFVDGVVGDVRVELTPGADGEVEFDAWLGGGVVATAKLVDRLHEEGFADVRCGDVPAYPARVGLRLVCRVRDDAGTAYLVATVTDRDGSVEIEDY